jgi:transposase
MDIKLHANATTTPANRKLIQASADSVPELAERFGVNESTIRRWQGRTSVDDRSSRPHTLQTNMSVEEEALIVELRTTVRLSLDDIVEVMKRCIDPSLSRSAIHRCLQRHGVSKPLTQTEPTKPHGTFDEYAVGFVHVDLKHLTKLQGKPAYVFVAIERATRFVHIEIVHQRDAMTIAACLERLIAAFPFKIATILTDNGAEFTDRFGSARWRSAEHCKPSGRHAFDKICARHGIKHRLTKVFSPQTNGLVERFNRRLGEAIASRAAVTKNEGKNKFLSHDDRNAFLLAFVDAYNHTRLKCLDYKAPLEAIANLPGRNTQAGIQANRGREHCQGAVLQPVRASSTPSKRLLA